MEIIKAVIDVGTNSIKFHAAKKRPDGSLETVLDRNDIARLGEGLRETGVIATGPSRGTPGPWKPSRQKRGTWS